MTSRNQNPRERGHALLSRINRWVIAGAIGLAGTFSIVAAETSHGKTSQSATSLQQPSSTPSSSSSGSSSSGSSSSTGSSSSSTGVVSGGS